MTTFDPSVLPDPRLLSDIRDLSRPGAPPTPTADWYTPMLLFGEPGTPLVVIAGTEELPGIPLMVGRIPIIHACAPIAWYVSSDVPATLALGLAYAPAPEFPTDPPTSLGEMQLAIADNPIYTPITVNLPTLTTSGRMLYEQTPSIVGWPLYFDRYSELQVSVTANDLAGQILLVLYMRKLRVR